VSTVQGVIMETLNQDNTLLFSELEAHFAEDKPCENSNHAVDKLHEGMGEWYLTAKPCSTCGTDKGTRLVCDKFAQYLINGGPISCGKCFSFLGNGMDAYRSIARK
jgi:hypothetical protein